MVNTNQKRLKTKKVVIMATGFIPELGGISGPILNPQNLQIGVVQSLVNARRKVYECNPDNTDERILLTTKNVLLDNFPKKKEPDDNSMIVERKGNVKVMSHSVKEVNLPVNDSLPTDTLYGDFEKLEK